MASPPPLMSSTPPPIHHLLCHNSLRTLIIILRACIIVSALHLYPAQPPPLFCPMFPRSATLLVIILRHHSFIIPSSLLCTCTPCSTCSRAPLHYSSAALFLFGLYFVIAQHKFLIEITLSVVYKDYVHLVVSLV